MTIVRCRQAGAGAPSVTVSSWPTVSRPNSSGMNAPTVTTTNIVRKNIAGERLEDAGHPLFCQLLESVLEMLRLHRVVDLDSLQDLGREIRETGDADRLALGQGVADPKAPVIGDADDVAGPGLLSEVALTGEEKHRRLHRHLASGSDVL